MPTATRREYQDEEHFVRLVSRQKQATDQTGKLLGVTHHAFALRVERNELYLSGSILDQVQIGTRNQLKATVTAMKSGGLKFGDNHAVVACNAGKIRDCGKKQKRKLRVQLEPKPNNAGYSAIRQLPLDNSDLRLLELLAAEAVVQISRIKDL